MSERTDKGNGADPPGTGAPHPEGPLRSQPAANEAAAVYKPKYFPLWNNLITIGGIYLATIALVLLLTFGLFSVVSPSSNPYVDIIGYLIIPGIMAVGVILMPLGILFRSWRLRRRDASQRLTIRFPRIDLNDPKQRSVAKAVLGGVFLLLPILGVSSYHGYHYTDSVEFCAKACHAVMEPQATAFETSSHARVACAECHIGSGASWFVKSKLSGTRQVLAVLRDSYSRPIPPAIEHLRPARDTCEQCHWPNKFFGAQLREFAHFASDEDNSRRDVKMLVKTGGADDTTGRAEGIHMHMLQRGVFEYVAVDDRLQDIPWVRWVDPLGEELIYRSDGMPASAPRPEGQLRRMDCMDCHNRPAHKFRSPNEAVNLFLDAGRIDTTLPFVKREVVAALTRVYPDLETAKLQIVNRIIEFYRMDHPERYHSDRASIRQAADMALRIYRENSFPYMKVDWRTYPDNIGHFYTPGCFRCHDGKHVNQYGVPISHECSVCHTFLIPVETSDGSVLIGEGDFVHPLKLEGMHATLRCDECHSGGAGLQPTCDGCHDDQQGLYGASLAVLTRFNIKPNPMFESVDCEGCHDLAQPVSIESVDARCLDCHGEEEPYVGMLAAWAESVRAAEHAAEAALAELEQRLDPSAEGAQPRAWLAQNREVLRAIKSAHPLHNPDGALEVFKTITREAIEQVTSIESRVARANHTEEPESDRGSE